jgi:hypothetical protein
VLMNNSISFQVVHATHAECSIVLNTKGFQAYLVYRWADDRQFSCFGEVDKQGLLRNVERDAAWIQPRSILLVVLFPNKQSIATLSIFLRSPVGLSDVRSISIALLRVSRYC